MGARIFLFLNVPPIDRSPGAINKTSDVRMKHKSIADWNKRMRQMAMNLSAVYPDNAVFLFDSNKFFCEALDDPTSHVETAGLTNTTGYCEVYKEKLFHYFDPIWQLKLLDS